MKFELLSLLFFISLFDTIMLSSIEKTVKKAVAKEMRGGQMSKRETPYLNDDASEVFGSVSDRELIYNMYNPERLAKRASSTPKAQSLKNEKDNIKVDKDDPKNCSCKPESTINTGTELDQNPSILESNQENDRNKYTVEKQYDDENNFKVNKDTKEENESENMKDEYIESRTVKKRPLNTTPRPVPTHTHKHHYKEDQDLKYGAREIDEQIQNAIKELCPNYKYVPDLDVQRMADVWQLAYYKADEILSCFKIFIKKTSALGRRRYEEKYSSFNGTITWHECLLELVSTGKLRDDRKHFLQATKSDKGILDNVIISESNEQDNKIITLQEQTPDQWLVTHNLLLMRDCGSGDVVIFTRVPSKPTWEEVERAMFLFGESDYGINGTEPCEVKKDGKNNDDVFRFKKYHIIS